MGKDEALTEALHNIVDHAHATKVTISLELKESHLRLSIQDNGSESLSANNPGVAHALKTMRRRIEDELQGTMRLHSPPVGTQFDILIPLPDP